MNHTPVFVTSFTLEELEKQATMGSKERSENKRLDSHQFDEDVE